MTIASRSFDNHALHHQFITHHENKVGNFYKLTFFTPIRLFLVDLQERWQVDVRG